jgi:hypothetical protein
MLPIGQSTHKWLLIQHIHKPTGIAFSFSHTLWNVHFESYFTIGFRGLIAPSYDCHFFLLSVVLFSKNIVQYGDFSGDHMLSSFSLSSSISSPPSMAISFLGQLIQSNPHPLFFEVILYLHWFLICFYVLIYFPNQRASYICLQRALKTFLLYQVPLISNMNRHFDN